LTALTRFGNSMNIESVSWTSFYCARHVRINRGAARRK